MPNSESAKKRLRQNETRRLRNKSNRSAVRTQIKKVRLAVEAGDIPKAEEELRSAVIKLDKAGATNLIHPNKAARHKSRLSKLVRDAK
ncbi:MAG: 30S ribosomal protein S20 [Planctomycetota bacterium]|nr:30S ribosomal protein S20 [Planctomycetota bacterium]